MPKPKVGAFIDGQNLYGAFGKKFPGKILNYRKILEKIQEFGDVWYRKIYLTNFGNNIDLLTALSSIGFEVVKQEIKTITQTDGTFRKKANCDTILVTDIFENIHFNSIKNRMEIIILGADDGSYKPIVKFLKKIGIRVVVIGVDISYELKTTVNEIIEIDKSFILNG